MGKSRDAAFRTAGIVLLLCVPVFLPRQYFSKATIEVKYTTADFSREFEAAELPYHGSVQIRGIHGTDLFEIGVLDVKPQKAADEANSIAAKLKLKLENKPPEWGQSPTLSPFGGPSVLWTPVVKIWEIAEPALKPGRL